MRFATLFLSLIAFTSSAYAEAVLVGPEDMPPGYFDQRNDISRTIYINRCEAGCTVDDGPNSATQNTTSVLRNLQSTTISPFGMKPDGAGGWEPATSAWEAVDRDALFDEVMTCLRDVFLPYDVEFVTEDPGMSFHHENMMAGLPDEIGRGGEGLLGIAPSGCTPLNNVISHTFASAHAATVENICWTAAHEIAHSVGALDHSYDCSDPMTYLGGCFRKYFRNENFQCGERDGPGPCRCGSTQNSHINLLNSYGPGPGPAAPEVTMNTPTEGQTVSDGFLILGFADHPRGIGQVELWLNGSQWDTLDGNESALESYNFAASTELPDGIIDVELRAYDDLGTPSSVMVTVQKGAPCTDAATDCLNKQQCEEGRCFWPEPTSVLGDTCDIDRDCISARCETFDGATQCVDSCVPGVSDQCPENFECVTLGGSDGVCWETADTAGCCQVDEDPKSGLLYVAAALALIAFVTWKRRKTASRQ